jgi:hypothetical protein
MNAREAQNVHGKRARSAIVAALCVLSAYPAQSQIHPKPGVIAGQIHLKPGVIAGHKVHHAQIRNYAYCEIAPVLGKLPKVVAQLYNTSAPGDYCPLDKMEAIDAEKLAAELGADIVYLNPTPQSARRYWVMDELWDFNTGETVDFHGVKATWMASMTPALMKEMMVGPYTPGEIHRESKYLYLEGSKVFLLRAPEGKTWVMQSYANEVDKRLTLVKLPQLGGKLKLPNGYKFEVVTLTKDLTIDLRRANGVAHIIRDDLHDVYEGCGFDLACDYIP